MMMLDEEGDQDKQAAQAERDSIWTIPLAWRALYFLLFTVYAFAGISFLIWYHVFENHGGRWPDTILSITQGIGITTVGAAGLALMTIEGPRTVMVVADYITQRWLNPLKERRRQEAEQRRQEAEQRSEQARQEAEQRTQQAREEGQAEARAEGRAQVQAEWEAWNERRMSAEASGENFDEPAPGTSSTEGE